AAARREPVGCVLGLERGHERTVGRKSLVAQSSDQGICRSGVGGREIGTIEGDEGERTAAKVRWRRDGPRIRIVETELGNARLAPDWAGVKPGGKGERRQCVVRGDGTAGITQGLEATECRNRKCRKSIEPGIVAAVGGQDRERDVVLTRQPVHGGEAVVPVRLSADEAYK